MYAIQPPAINTNKILEASILRTLAWFDLFRYPITANELLYFLDRPATPDALKKSLTQLQASRQVYMLGGFYALHNDPALVIRRRKGNEKATRMLRKAYRIGRLLYCFPFVRAVCISGSLSKCFADEQADIDFFIVTSANRLWIARTAMHVLKKLSYCWGGQHSFCMNFYIDEQALEIPEQNYFTAIEMITLLPVCGEATTNNMMAANSWIQQYFPAARNKEAFYTNNQRVDQLKHGIEWLIDRLPGAARLDDYLMRITASRWQEKEAAGLTNMRGGKMALLTAKHFSKPNPRYFQVEILERYRRKLEMVLK
ncbi:hypothetical protein [Paraflavitalea pollutisoli]|uniref:hypothetical protein n=1 Tax=Paraflavitalea pollutisoli TaxID=3034143 RepID=UPI0023EAB528|nr:hypothetical protein [Paraflavitalea sp. H1-2-19X]